MRNSRVQVRASAWLGTTCALLVAGSTLAQNYSIDWYTMDGGGGTSTGGNYSVSGTIGQPDAGTMSGGNFTLQGGFWATPASAGTPVLIHIRLNGDGTITLEWNGGGTLQAAPSVLGAWQDVTSAASPYTFTPTLPALFVRVRF